MNCRPTPHSTVRHGNNFRLLGNGPCHRHHRGQAEQTDEFEFHYFLTDLFADFLVNVRVQHADERQIAVTLGKIKPVTDDKKIGNFKADVIRLHLFHAARRFVEQHADF